MNATATFQIRSDKTKIAAGQSNERIIELKIKSPTAAAAKERVPINIAMVIDRSGSMSGAKLVYVKQAVMHVLNMLSSKDRIALVAYDDTIHTILESQQFDPNSMGEYENAVRSIYERGMTNLSGGWFEGCRQVTAGMNEHNITRVLLLTDGLANQGITDPDTLAYHARELHERGVATSTFGVGDGFHELLLESIADQGGGTFYYIDQPGRITPIFAEEFSELTSITAKNSQFQLQFSSNVGVDVLGGWRFEADGEHRIAIHMGDLAADQERSVFIRLTIPASQSGSAFTVTAAFSAEDQDQNPIARKESLQFDPVEADVCNAAPVDPELMGRFARNYFSQRMQSAFHNERAGRRAQAAGDIDSALHQVGEYLDEQEQNEYRRLRMEISMGLSENRRKEAHYDNYRRRKTRDEIARRWSEGEEE
ncbi:MAG: VWA domain-containing protein [Anaerolineaceae bacterium]|nr:VWA domain-containing protein [Anaerolineaceae bacterium]